MSEKKLEDLFEEYLILYKLVNRKTILDLLKSELNTAQLIEIYQKSDGERSTREIAGLLQEKCSHSKIANLWNKWDSLGLVVPASRKGRYKAVINLEEYGFMGTSDLEDN